MAITPQDFDNAKIDLQTVSEISNSVDSAGTPIDSTITRLGNTTDTLVGRLKRIGYLPPVAYAGSIAFGPTDNVKTIDRAGTVYAPNPTDLPFTTSGTWAADDEDKFFVVQGLVFDQLNSILPPFVAAEFQTVAGMVAGTAINDLTVNFSDYVGRDVHCVWNNSTSKEGGAWYTIKTLAQAATDGDIIDGTGSPNYYGGNHELNDGVHCAILRNESLNIFQFGKIRGVDSDTIIDAAIAYSNSTSVRVSTLGDEIVYTGSLDTSIFDGEGSITSNSVLFKPQKFHTQSVNASGSWGFYCEELGGSKEDAYKLASLGASYVIYNFYGLTDAGRVALAQEDFANLSEYGIGVILGIGNSINTVSRTSYITQFKDETNLIGWYVYDEPLTNSISKADQVAAIAASKAVRNLPCYCSEHGNVFPSPALPDGYDFVFIDTYYQAVNGNAGILTEEKVLEWYASSVRSIFANYKASQCIPIYETYATTVTTPLIDEGESFYSMYNKKRLLGSGCFFIYSADSTNPATLLTIKNTPQLERIAKRVIEAPTPDKFKFEEITISVFDATYGPVENKIKSRWRAVTASDSTSVIKAGGISRYGVFIDAGDYWIIDFGRIVKSCRLVGRFFNNGSAGGTSTTWDYYIPFNASTTEGYVYSSETVTTDGAGNANFAEYFQNIYSRYLVIDSAAYSTWNTATGFDAFHVSIIE